MANMKIFKRRSVHFALVISISEILMCRVGGSGGFGSLWGLVEWKGWERARRRIDLRKRGRRIEEIGWRENRLERWRYGIRLDEK